MIGMLRGKILELSSEIAILDVGGVGYELLCSSNTIDELAASPVDADMIKLLVHTHVREDALQLFGFCTRLEKQMFLSLLKVNGVGPKMALKILSGARLKDLVEMIESGDVKALSGIPKVGKKTAEQLILTLKGQMGIEEATLLDRTAGHENASGTVISAPLSVSSGRGSGKMVFRGVKRDLLSALVNLGYKSADVEQVVSEMSDDVDLQNGLRDALQVLSGHRSTLIPLQDARVEA